MAPHYTEPDIPHSLFLGAPLGGGLGWAAFLMMTNSEGAGALGAIFGAALGSLICIGATMRQRR